MTKVTSIDDPLLGRGIRETVRKEISERFLPSMLGFLDDEIGTVDGICTDCTDSMQKAHLQRLSDDLAAIRASFESFASTSLALLRDR